MNKRQPSGSENSLRKSDCFFFFFRALLENVTVVEDNPSERSLRVRTSGSIKERSKVPF